MQEQDKLKRLAQLEVDFSYLRVALEEGRLDSYVVVGTIGGQSFMSAVGVDVTDMAYAASVLQAETSKLILGNRQDFVSPKTSKGN